MIDTRFLKFKDLLIRVRYRTIFLATVFLLFGGYILGLLLHFSKVYCWLLGLSIVGAYMLSVCRSFYRILKLHLIIDNKAICFIRNLKKEIVFKEDIHFLCRGHIFDGHYVIVYGKKRPFKQVNFVIKDIADSAFLNLEYSTFFKNTWELLKKR